MATVSYPAVGTGGLDDRQWSNMYEHVDGIVNDFTGNSCKLNRVNATDTCVVGSGLVSVNGYVLEITGSQELYCAPVAVGQPDKTYLIAAVYDPSLNIAQADGSRDELGPVRLVITDQEPDYGGGKAWVVLWRLIRKPSQLLQATEATDFRRWIGPTLEVSEYKDVIVGYGPYARGTLRVERSTGDISIRTRTDANNGLEWRSLNAPPWKPFPKNSPLIGAGTAPLYQRQGDRISVIGALKRANGNKLNTGSDVTLGTFTGDDRPMSNQRFICPVSTFNNGVARVTVFTSGVVVMSDPGRDLTWIDLSPIVFRAR